MLKKLLRIFIVAVGFAIGPGIVYAVMVIIGGMIKTPVTDVLQFWAVLLLYLVSAAITGIIFLILSNRIAEKIVGRVHHLEEGVLRTSPAKVTGGLIGLIIGLVLAALLSVPIGTIPVAWVSTPLTIITFIILGWLGWSLGYKRRIDISTLSAVRARKEERPEIPQNGAKPKVLDTSAIIDGRIYDLCKTGIFEGDIVIPGFVVTELQHIADSADSIKRQKGRRGLDILHKMQEELSGQIRLTDRDFEDVAEVDAKLIRLASELHGKVVTTDFNLNKVARVYDVPVFNINELSNAVKPVLLPGEELRVTIVKDGKEAGQGVAYLDDGTMIVVDGGKGRSGEELDVAVTSVLQTAAGRMIFARIK